MYASGGMRSGLGVMLLVSLTGAAIVAPRRLAYLYAALATIALLLEQSYWVLAHDAPPATSCSPGCSPSAASPPPASPAGWRSASPPTRRWRASAAARSRTQTRVNQLVIEDMHDGVLVLDRDGRVVQHNPQAQRLLGAERAARRRAGASCCPASARAGAAGAPAARRRAPPTSRLRGRDLRLRLLDAATEEELSVLFVEDTTRAREQAQQLKLAALGRLTANIAHEIRNPLSAISHAAELLGEEKRGAGPRRA